MSSTAVAPAQRRITQETFDEVIKENVDEFEMSPQEALEEAIKQFTSQGVSLVNIDTSGGVGRQEMLDELGRLQGAGADCDTLASALQALSLLCDASHAMGARNRMLLVTHKGSLNALHALVSPAQPAEVLLQALRLMRALCKGNIEARDFFEPDGSKNVVGIMAITSPHVGSATVLNAALDLARCAAKSENNKLQLMKKGMGETIVRLLTREGIDEVLGAAGRVGMAEDEASSVFSGAAVSAASAAGEHDTRCLLLQNACLMLRGLCVHDDLRRDMSCAMDNGKFFVNAPNLVPGLMRLSAAFKSYPDIAGAALSAAKTLVTTEESVQVMAQHGAMDLPCRVLGYPAAVPSLVRHALGLTRNLCADDIRKDRLVMDGTLELIVASVSEAEKSQDPVLVEHGLACLAAMSLRSPSNSRRIMGTGAATVMVLAMRKHADRAAVQRQGCLAFRNMAARCPEFRLVMLDAGAEEVLRAAGRHQAAVDEAYAALRDLGCEVQKVKITADGRIEAAYEAFGAPQGGKLKFNPIYDETSSITSRVQEEAHAPFDAPTLRPFNIDENDDPTSSTNISDHDHSHEHSHKHEEGGSCCGAGGK